ncbi:MAG: hypothetical protein M3256_04220 [Actinomycetota bacterium]|nr:hypothetical protein [Actinomycetota bacterium]
MLAVLRSLDLLAAMLINQIKDLLTERKSIGVSPTEPVTFLGLYELSNDQVCYVSACPKLKFKKGREDPLLRYREALLFC